MSEVRLAPKRLERLVPALGVYTDSDLEPLDVGFHSDPGIGVLGFPQLCLDRFLEYHGPILCEL